MTTRIDATIMGQAYTLSCKKGEEKVLQEAVSYLDEKMRTIRDAGKIKGNDRIAVMASISIAAELLLTKSSHGPFHGLTISEIQQQLEVMNTLLDEALAPQEKLF